MPESNLTPDAIDLIRQHANEPWAVYEGRCLRVDCMYRYVGIAPVAAETIELWECPQCGQTSVQWHRYEG